MNHTMVLDKCVNVAHEGGYGASVAQRRLYVADAQRVLATAACACAGAGDSSCAAAAAAGGDGGTG